MSAQASPLTPSQSSEAVNSPKNTSDNINAELSVNFSYQNPESITSKSPKKLLPNDDQSRETALDEIEAIQQAILSDEEFDFTQLEATAAGQESPVENTNNSETFSSNAIIEKSEHQVNYYGKTSTIGEPRSPSETQDIGRPAPNTSQLESSVDALNIIHDNSPLSLGNTTEDFQLSFQGNIDTQHQFSANTISSDFGTISYNESGHWQYALDNNAQQVQSLGAGETITDNITIQSKNGSNFLIEITINGTNDQATLTGSKTQEIQALSVSEQSTESAPETSGKLSIQDTDAGEALFQAENDIQGIYGTASIDSSGEWHYTLKNDLSVVQGIVTGESLNDIFSVKTLDGSSQLIQVTIHGIDDKPFLSRGVDGNGSNKVEMNLATQLKVENQLNIQDPDFGQSHFVAQEEILSDSGLGIGSIDTLGHWTYNIDTSHASVATFTEGQKLYDTFTVFTADGTEQKIIIEIVSLDTPSLPASTPLIIDLANDALLTTSNASDNYIINNSETASNLETFFPTNEEEPLTLNELLTATDTSEDLDSLLPSPADDTPMTTASVNNFENGSYHENYNYTEDSDLNMAQFTSSENTALQQLIQPHNPDILA